jgi:predicted TIM-barrel fold metal-dependent hydrolase
LAIHYKGMTIEVIDFHTHTFPDKIAEKTIHKLESISKLTTVTNGTLDDMLVKSQANGVDKSVVLNIATLPTQQTTINNCAYDTNQLHKNSIISFGSVHFLAEDALQELDRIKELDLKGIKLHPDYQGFMIDDKRLFPIYEKCAELGLIIVFHSGWDFYSPNLIHASPIASRNVIQQFPNLKIVLAHFGGIHCWDEVERYLVGENVYFDTSMCYTFVKNEQMERMIKNHDGNKILLGSDCPWENPKDSINFILSLNISDLEKEKILGLNAKALLNI